MWEKMLARSVVSGSNMKATLFAEVHVLNQILNLTLLSTTPIRLAPTQTRILPLKLTQNYPLPPSITTIPLKITLISATSTDKTVVEVELTVSHVSGKEGENVKIKASYFYAESMPSNFVVLPPLENTGGKGGPGPVVLALRMFFLPAILIDVFR